MTSQSPTVYCLYCHISHPREDMRQIVTKSGKRWRCVHSIENAKRDRIQRELFGKQVTQSNTNEARKQLRFMLGKKSDSESTRRAR